MKKFSLFFSVVLLISLAGCSTLKQESADEQSVGRDFSTLVADESNELSAIQSIFKEDQVWANSDIEVVSFNGILLLVGQTPTNSLKKQAEIIVSKAVKAKKTYNEIRVAAPTSTLTYLSDLSLTSKVKTALVLADGVDGSKIKVVTEDGEVFLLGIVSRDTADLAVEAARKISGVKRVIKAFEILSK